MGEIDFYFDCSSPGTYLSFLQLEEFEKTGTFRLNLHPIFIGGVFKAVNPQVFRTRETMPACKEAYIAKDFRDWARLLGVRLCWPHPCHPVNSVTAMRGCIAAGDKLRAFARSAFEAMWRDGLDISDPEVLGRLCDALDIPRAEFFAAIESDVVKARLRRNTEELIARGGFGAPTFFVNGDDMYWGNDRFDFVRRAILASPEAA